MVEEMGMRDLRRIEAALAAWAAERYDVRAAVVVGSQARTDPPADEWSDLDVVIYAREPAQLLADTSWLAAIAPTWITIPYHTASGEPELLVLFAGGHDVDIVVHDAAELAELARRREVPVGHLRGARVLVDKDNLVSRTFPASFRPPTAPLPSAAEYSAQVAAFWYGAHYVAKQIRRGDLWVVKIRDAELKTAVLRMIEWHARSADPTLDTWHLGRFLECWADPRAVAAVARTFGRFDVADCWTALLATMDLFSWLAEETADRLGFPHSLEPSGSVAELVQRLRAQDPRLDAPGTEPSRSRC
jgi:aminoglycoside 6-adenylyltransferase